MCLGRGWLHTDRDPGRSRATRHHCRSTCGRVRVGVRGAGRAERASERPGDSQGGAGADAQGRPLRERCGGPADPRLAGKPHGHGLHPAVVGQPGSVSGSHQPEQRRPMVFGVGRWKHKSLRGISDDLRQLWSGRRALRGRLHHELWRCHRRQHLVTRALLERSAPGHHGRHARER